MFEKEDNIKLEINETYLKKYSQPGNKKYAQGITKPEYADYTMEFKIRNYGIFILSFNILIFK